jgi:hypothetical protein
MAKYDGLGKFLSGQAASELPMTFKDVEDVLGTKLPASASDYPAWWANDVTSHVQAKAWLNAGYETQQVDVQARKLVFKYVGVPHPPRDGLDEPRHGFKHETKQPRRHPLFGAMKGLLTIEPGYDLTQPAMPEWADLLDAKYGPEKPK